MKISRDLSFQIKKEVYEEMHFHPEMEFLFVINGTVKVTISDSPYLLGKESCICINSGVFHEIATASNALAGIIFYPCELIAEFTENKNCLFLCNSTSEKESVYYEMLPILHELVYLKIYPSHKTGCYVSSLLLRLLDLLIANCRIDNSASFSENISDDSRMNHLLTYINQNFREDISLSDVAENMFVSTSTLSRFFKKQSGMYFADYLNRLRVHSAVSDLLYTEKSITHIALDNGFSNPSAFHRSFTALYHRSPSDFRKEQREKIQREEACEHENNALLIEELKSLGFANPTFNALNAEQSVIDTGNGKPYEKNWNIVINIGSVHNLTLANLQYHVLYLTETLGFRYVRMWNPFSTRLMITDGIRGNRCNYDRIDGILDFLVNSHIYPFIDFGKRPDTALSATGRTIWYEDENVVFQSRQLWESAIHDLMQHIVKRYGNEEVSNWIFELSYDQFHSDAAACYIDSNYDYFNAFAYFYNTVKSFAPKMQVGGPSAIVPAPGEFLRGFLKTCRIKQCMPDFVSIFAFPYVHSDKAAPSSYHKAFQNDVELSFVLKARQILKDEEMDQCKLYVTEWNNSISNRNFLNDSPFRAAYIVKHLSQLADKVDIIGIWMGSDWISSYYDTQRIANGGSGLLTKDTIRKPAYFAFSFMNRLGGTLLDVGEHYIATSNGVRSYYILCHNYKRYNSNYYTMDENIDSPDDIAELFQDNLPIDLNLVLENVPDQTRYIIKRRCINMQEGNILNEWSRFMYDDSLSHSDVKYLRESCLPGLSMEKQTTKAGKLEMHITLQPHEISLLHIYEDV